MNWPQVVVIIWLTLNFCIRMVEQFVNYDSKEPGKLIGGVLGTVLGVWLTVWVLRCGGFWG